MLVSACLLGHAVRYNGRLVECDHPVLRRWVREKRVVPFCPEVAGGLSVPRPPAEVSGLSVVTPAGEDVTGAFERGARAAIELARGAGVIAAVLKDGSPSCGSTWVYDGTFSGTRRPGLGITAALLRQDGIPVFDETSLDAADAYVRARRKHA